MGGYGGASGRKKERCYYDTGNKKVTDKNAVAVAEHYLREGKYVAFLKEKPPHKRPDLSVDHEILVEVKGMESMDPDRVKNNIRKGFKQINSDLELYTEENRHPGKVIILSRHSNVQASYEVALEGYHKAKSQGFVHGTVEYWNNGYIIELK